MTHHRRGVDNGGPKLQFLDNGSNINGLVSDGRKLCVLAATRTKRPDAVTDWIGRILDMKDGCRVSMQSGGGVGRGLHLHAIGSKQKKPTECDSHWSWTVIVGARSA